jgi:iron complex outermembrane receptor protein
MFKPAVHAYPLARIATLVGVVAVAMTAIPATGDDLDTLDLETPIPTVLTPVRLKQPRPEVPASVTVIDRQLIEASGIRQLAEIFRLVPGTAVGARDGWNYVVSYHGTSYRDSRRMQVLVDGRSVYQAGLATIDWNDIPVALEDIERIEIVRGPDTAAYGANAFLGVISIVTRHPEDAVKLRIKATAGDLDTEDYYASAAGKIGTAGYRVSANTRRDSGFDHKNSGQARRDSTNLQLLNTRWSFTPRDNWNLEIAGGFKTGLYTEDFGETDLTPGDHDVSESFASVVSEHFLSARNSLKWQLDYATHREESDWRTCAPTSAIGIPRTILPRNSVICADVNEDGRNQRVDLDVQNTLIGVAPWKLVGGLHVQQQRAESATFYDGAVERLTTQLFANFEYKFLPQWSATIGGSQEYASSIGQNFSPRLALLFLPSEEHSIRAVYSEAIRTPDMLETEANWSYYTRNATLANGGPIPVLGSSFRLPYTALAPEHFREETIRSHEIGYYGLWLNRRLQTDIKFFSDSLDNLSSTPYAYFRFNPTNQGQVEQRGHEIEIDFRATDFLRLRGTYALIRSDIDESYTQGFRDSEFTPRHSGSASAILELPARWQLSTNYFYMHPINTHKFSRINVRLQKSLEIFSSTLQLAAIAHHDFSDDGDLFNDNRYDSSTRMWFTAELMF